MSIIVKLFLFFISLPARAKGMRFGRNSFIGPGYDWFFVHLHGISLGDNVMIGRSAWLETGKQGRIIVGAGSQIGRHVVMSARQKITIGKKCLVSYNVSILDSDHNAANPKISPLDSGLTKAEEISIGDHCFIGAHSFILKGVRLGRHCVVGANSVVTKSFPDYSVIAGNPARLIRKI